jgi:hypothetical protein
MIPRRRQLDKDHYLSLVRERRWSDAWDFMPDRLTQAVGGDATHFLSPNEISEVLSIIESEPHETTFDCEAGTLTLADLRSTFLTAFTSEMPKLSGTK